MGTLLVNYSHLIEKNVKETDFIKQMHVASCTGYHNGQVDIVGSLVAASYRQYPTVLSSCCSLSARQNRGHAINLPIHQIP